jgi:thiamine biosynthesis lipoprotein
VIELGGATMGTTWRVRFAAPAAADRPAIRQAIAALLAAMVAEMSHWEAGSVLSRFNRAPAGSWTALPPAFATVMTAALDVAARSGGAFDPAVGRLVDAWGFGPVPSPGVPDDATVARLLAASGWQRLTLDRVGRWLHQPGGLALDLSGITKGYAVDAVADLLGGMGLRHCLVEIGGEFAGRGLKPDGEPWWVDLELPPGACFPPLRIALHQMAVATSGDHVRGAHTIDPRTGRPVQHAASVSVLHESAMIADAWASALSVLDLSEAIALAGREQLACRIIHRRPNGFGELLSPALIALLSD